MKGLLWYLRFAARRARARHQPAREKMFSICGLRGLETGCILDVVVGTAPALLEQSLLVSASALEQSTEGGTCGQTFVRQIMLAEVSR
jgi:hypothetical protein